MQIEPDGTYRPRGVFNQFLLPIREVENAVPPFVAEDAQPSDDLSVDDIARSKDLANRRFGWMQAGSDVPVPEKWGLYIVERVGTGRLRVLAYMDRNGHAWAVDHFIVETPDRAPDMRLIILNEITTPECERGLVGVRPAGGEGEVWVSRYRLDPDGLYSLYDSWFQFGDVASGLGYADLMTRCFCAFFYRAGLGGQIPPYCHVDAFDGYLLHQALPLALESVLSDGARAESDPMLRPFPLVSALRHWLIEADAESLSKIGPDDIALRVMRTLKYADPYLVVRTDEGGEGKRVSDRGLYALEAALNRYKIIRDLLGDDAESAGADAVGALSNSLFDLIVRDLPDIAPLSRDAGQPASPASAPAADPDTANVALIEGYEGEWEFRRGFAERLEQLRAAYRVMVEFRVDLASGIVAVVSHVPDESLMPKSAWSPSSSSWVELDPATRAVLAARYWKVLGVAVAACAFAQSDRIERVLYQVRFPSWDEDGNLAEASDSVADDGARVATISREAFADQGAYRSIDSDPASFARLLSSLFPDGESESDACGGGVFSAVDSLEGPARASRLPESEDGEIPPAHREALGARYASDMRILYQSVQRSRAEGLAESFGAARSVSEAVQAAQELRDSVLDPIDRDGCTRVMELLVRGELDRSDKNAVVNAYLGEDPYAQALVRARSLFETDPDAALESLRATIDAAELSGKYADTLEVVHRVFDSYAARLVYNLARTGALNAANPTLGIQDADRRVELAPSSLHLCYIEAERLMERSFSDNERAIEYGRRACELAPSSSVAHRQLARSCMLVGDLENARAALWRALRVSVSATDVALCYYQLAYVLWKQGHPQEAALCYLKSASMSAVAAPQSMAELRELADESDVELCPRSEIDDRLREAGIVVAPTDEVMDALLAGARAAADSGLHECARDFLATSMQHRPDDALFNVARSFKRGSL